MESWRKRWEGAQGVNIYNICEQVSAVENEPIARMLKNYSPHRNVTIVQRSGSLQSTANGQQACKALMTQTVTKVSCEPPLNEFIGRIQICSKKNPGPITCKFGICVVKGQYHLNGDTPDSINYTRAYTLLNKLDKEQPDTTNMNECIREYCIFADGYLNFPDYINGRRNRPICNSLKYLRCALFCYLMGQNITSKEYEMNKSGCSTIAQNVQRCRPYFKNHCPCTWS